MRSLSAIVALAGGAGRSPLARRRLAAAAVTGAPRELRLRDRQRQPLRRPARWPSGSAPSTSSSSTASWRRAEEVAALRDGGTTVLGYLSVGTIEKWRAWYPRLKRYRLGAWQDWKDEWFADVSQAGCAASCASGSRREMLAKGFDGLFLDNVDMVEARRHRASATGMRELVLALSSLAHSDGRLLFAQNGALGAAEARPARRDRRLEPRGRHLDLRLRPAPLRRERRRAPPRRAARAARLADRAC